MAQKLGMIKIRNNKIVVGDVTFNGRKIPKAKIRQKMLKEHLCYITLRTDNDFQSLTGDETINELKYLVELPNDDSLSNERLVNKLKSLERTQHLMFRHDGSTMVNQSYFGDSCYRIKPGSIYQS